MKNINIIILGLGFNNYNQATVKIYDDCNRMIVNKKTYNGKLKVCLKMKKCYKIVICNSYNNYIKYFYVNNDDNYVFKLSNSLYNYYNYPKKSITFLLTDYNYDNLKIEKGELVFNG